MMGKFHSLRIVIQQLGFSEMSGYRVVVYGDEFKPRHADFSSAQVLRAVLRSAIPHFDSSHLSWTPLGDGEGSIVFDGEMQLSESQFFELGLS
ncbi:MAG: hypothetical protein WCF17_06540 [Terracidiphilus sp.]